MSTRRTATTAATALAALTAGGLLLASAATVSAQDRPDRAPTPVPGMSRMHQQMTEQDPGMTQMHELRIEKDPGMTQMHELMTDGPQPGSTGP